MSPSGKNNGGPRFPGLPALFLAVSAGTAMAQQAPAAPPALITATMPIYTLT